MQATASMKPLLILLTAFTLTTGTYAQGQVEFENIRAGAPILMPDGTGPGPAGRAQLYMLTETGYSAVGPIQGFLSVADLPESRKYIIPIVVTIPGTFAGQLATFQVRAWVDAPTWETALLRGESNDVTFDLGGGLAGPAYLEGLQSFTLVPEPLTLTLSLLAAGGLLLTHRKRKAKP